MSSLPESVRHRSIMMTSIHSRDHREGDLSRSGLVMDLGKVRRCSIVEVGEGRVYKGMTSLRSAIMLFVVF